MGVGCGLNVRSACDGDLTWGVREPNMDNAIDQVMVGDIDPAHPGMEVWINKGLKQLFYTAKGEPISGPAPNTSELVWWDADLLREQLGGGGSGGRGPRPGAVAAAASPSNNTILNSPLPRPSPAPGSQGASPSAGGEVRAGLAGGASRHVGKWKDGSLHPVTTGIQGQIFQIADILGDWREEIVTFTDGELRIYNTTIPAEDRHVCLMQDPIYRHSVSFRTVGYTHVPQLSYYRGTK